MSEKEFSEEIKYFFQWTIQRFRPKELIFLVYILEDYSHSTGTGIEICKKLGSCFSKLMAVNYHRNNLSIAFEKNKRFCQRTMKRLVKKGIAYSYQPLDIIFEFESFLLQTKSFLDIFSCTLGMYFDQKPSNIKHLKNVLSKRDSTESRKILEILERNKWLNDFESDENSKSLRDIIAHYSELITDGFLIDKRLGKEKIERPKIGSSNMYIEDYYGYIYNELIKLTNETVTFLHENFKDEILG